MFVSPLRLKSLLLNLRNQRHPYQQYKWIFRGWKPSRRLIASSIGFSFIAACAAAMSTGSIGALLKGLTHSQAAPIKIGIGQLDTLLGSQDEPHLQVYKLAGFTLFFILFQTLTTFWGQLSLRYLAVDLVNRIRIRIYNQLQAVSLSFYHDTTPGNLLNTLTNEVNFIQQALISFSNALAQFFVLIGYASAMLYLSWQLSLAILIVFGMLSTVLKKARLGVRQASLAVPEANQNFATIALESINGMSTIHAYNAQRYEQNRYRMASRDVLIANRRMIHNLLRVPPITQSIASSLLIGLIVVSYELLIRRGTMDGTTLIAFLFAMSRAIPLMVQLSNARVNAVSLEGSLTSVKALLQRHNKPFFVDGSYPLEGLERSIDFRDVTFGHQTGQTILHQINLSFQQGQTTALVGASGSGKTTIANLVLRFYDPTQGQVLIDGIDLRDIKIETLRQRMAIVSQDTFIFNTSVRDNIAYGLPDCSDEDVIDAAIQANALDFILQMPDGFDTILGDRGMKLSGGQRQRIAIARAILRNPDILILDEATSALDSVTEQKIQEALTQLSQGRTVIMVAHRLSTIVNADQIYVLDQGTIVEAGTLNALIERRGQFWEYYQKQTNTHLPVVPTL